MNTLVVYYSLSNNNELLAKEIYKQWDGNCDLYRIVETTKRSNLTILIDQLFNRIPRIKLNDFPVKEYDNYVFVAPVWMGKLASPLKAFLLKQKNKMKSYSFITICGGIDGQKEKLTAQLNATIGYMPWMTIELRIDELHTKQVDAGVSKSHSHVTAKDFVFFQDEINELLKYDVAPSTV